MKYIKILMALAVVCILVMPAFSQPNMPDNKMGLEGMLNPCDGKKPLGLNGMHDPCDRPIKSIMGQDEKQLPCDGQKPMGQDDKQNPLDGQVPLAQNDQKSFERPIKSMMGGMGNHDGVKAVIVSVEIIQ